MKWNKCSGCGNISNQKKSLKRLICQFLSCLFLNTYDFFEKKMFSSRNSRPLMLFKIGVLKNFANFTGKHLLESLFNKACNAGVFLRNL